MTEKATKQQTFPTGEKPFATTKAHNWHCPKCGKEANQAIIRAPMTTKADIIFINKKAGVVSIRRPVITDATYLSKDITVKLTCGDHNWTAIKEAVNL